MLEFEAFLKTSDPGRLIRIFREDWFPEPEVEITTGTADEASAVVNTLRCAVLEGAREEAGRHGLRIAEPGRMFLRRR